MTSGAQTAFTVQTDRLPEQIQKLVIAVSTDGGLIRDVSEGLISLRSGGSSADYRFSGQNFSQERALSSASCTARTVFGAILLFPAASTAAWMRF